MLHGSVNKGPLTSRRQLKDPIADLPDRGRTGVLRNSPPMV